MIYIWSLLSLATSFWTTPHRHHYRVINERATGGRVSPKRAVLKFLAFNKRIESFTLLIQLGHKLVNGTCSPERQPLGL